MLRQDMGPFREREWIVRVPFVGIRTFAVSRIPPDNIRHLLAPDTNSETEDEDYDYDFDLWEDDGAVEHWLANTDE